MLQTSIYGAFFVNFELEGIYPKLMMEFKTTRHKMYRDDVPHCKSQIDWRRICTLQGDQKVKRSNKLTLCISRHVGLLPWILDFLVFG